MLVALKISREENANTLKCAIGDIVKLDIEDYVKGVVPSEMSGPEEALKAQAVASRTIAYKASIQNLTLSDLSTKTQAFREVRRVSSAYAKQHQAVESTRGEVLFYNGSVLSSCPFSASNGGKIISSAEKWGGVRAYLISKDDPYDAGPKNGHGVGMSQTGAKNMASLGYTYKDILNFYYPGSTLETTIIEEVETMGPKALKVKDWALSKKGCGYAWGASGYILTQAKLNSLIKQYPDYVSQSRNGKWLGKQVFDCAQFVRLALKEVGISLVSGASSQWKKTDWEQTGTIDTLPKDKLCILYRESSTANPMQHTGIYLGDGYVMDARGSSSGVVYSKLSSYKWSHWAIPKGLYEKDDNIITEEVYQMLYQATVIADSGSTVRMRKGPGSSYGVVASIKLGTVVDVVAENGTWLQIMYAGSTGFMMKKFLTKVDAPVTAPSKDWYVKIKCENENDAKAIVSAIAKLSKAAIVEE